MGPILPTATSGSIWLVIGTGLVCLIIGGLLGRMLHSPAAGAGIKPAVAAMILAGMVIAGLLVWGLSSTALLSQLSSVASSRGIVAYLLLITTSCVIVIAAIGNYWITDNIEAKHRASKDLVSLLLTLVGPILGFYFGTSTPFPATPPVTPPATTITPTNSAPANAGPMK